MVGELTGELQARLSRLRDSSSNGRDAAASATAPSPDDLDWFLFRSFPGYEVGADVLRELLPVYRRALRDGAVFDCELLYVRLLEFGDALDVGVIRSIARAAVERMEAGGFDPPDGLATLRFAIRVLPADDPFPDSLFGSPETAALCFRMLMDFVLDEREVDEYLAVSYLREGDPEADPILQKFPIPEITRSKVERFFGAESCRCRIEEGWTRWSLPAEREELRAVLRRRIPELAI